MKFVLFSFVITFLLGTDSNNEKINKEQSMTSSARNLNANKNETEKQKPYTYKDLKDAILIGNDNEILAIRNTILHNGDAAKIRSAKNITIFDQHNSLIKEYSNLFGIEQTNYNKILNVWKEFQSKFIKGLASYDLISQNFEKFCQLLNSACDLYCSTDNPMKLILNTSGVDDAIHFEIIVIIIAHEILFEKYFSIFAENEKCFNEFKNNAIKTNEGVMICSTEKQLKDAKHWINQIIDHMHSLNLYKQKFRFLRE